MKKRLQQLEKYLTYGSFIILAVGMVLFLYWSIRPYDVLEHEIVPYEVLTPELKAGDTLEMRVKFCKHYDYTAYIKSEYINHSIIYLPEASFDLKPGCYEKVVYKELPDVMPSGEYRYRETIEYQVNPIRTVKYRLESEPFTIIKQ